MTQARLEWVRCRKCSRSLYRAYLVTGSMVEIKCDRCHELNLQTAHAIDGAMVPDGAGGFILTLSE